MNDRAHPSKSTLIASILLTLFAGAWLFAQAPQQAPSPPQNPPSAAPLRVSARLVQVNVIAQDKDGKPVTDLTRDDFTVLDDGAPQKISLFSALPAPALPPISTAATTLAAPHVFSNRMNAAPGVSTSVTMLLLDAVNTGSQDMSYAQTQILKFTRQMRPEDQLALYLLTPSKLYILHDFTSDSATLVRVLGGSKKDTNTSDPDVVAANAANKRMKNALSDAMAESNRLFKGTIVDKAGATSEAMQFIAKRVAPIPGRKNLVWVSGGFPLSFGYGIGNSGRANKGNFTGMLSNTAKVLSSANVSVYPVDVRGLLADPDILGMLRAPSRFGSDAREPIPGATQTGAPPDDRPIQTMNNIANGTGGRAFYNGNDLAGGIRRAIDDSRVSYSIGYYPDHNTWDGKFRQITVKVNRPGITLRYRVGYFATPEGGNVPDIQKQMLSDAIRSPIQLIDLGLEVRVEPVNASNGRQLKVDIRVSPDQMHFEQAGDRWTDSIEVVWVALSADGRMMAHGQHAFTMRPPQKSFDEIMHDGLSFSEHVSVKGGSVEMRLVVRDVGSRATGSVNIPLTDVFGGAGK